jgi:CHAT domain-containing protein
MSYSHAMSEMKRAFLADERYSAPFYWAPFVFYGDYGAGDG